MFILCVQQVVTDETFKKQGGKDEVCLYIRYYLNGLVFSPCVVLFLLISRTYVRMCTIFIVLVYSIVYVICLVHVCTGCHH